ncbi:MAG: helix-turn-helix domain-containing protein [Oscillospiraceae bacterium]|jgi:transposase-like protein|nr:helix-turn-helix domain-containing protein [Oscillospiraceae bacterium]
MPKKGKIPKGEKVRLVEGYLNRKLGYTEAKDIAGIDDKTWRNWISRYKIEGPTGLQPGERNRVYTAELKVRAAKDYLDGVGSLRDICEKYRVNGDRQLRAWIKVYNRHGEFKTFTGGSRMTKARKTTQEERQAISEECMAEGCNYGETALKYNVSYQQIYTWVKKVQEQGSAGLDDRRGHRPTPHEPLTEEERLRQENEQLKKANYRLQMEIDYIKKLKEVEGRNR